MKFKDLDKKLLVIIFISIIATFNAGYLTYMAYTVTAPAFFGAGAIIADTSYSCDINTMFSCSTVFADDFAWIFGLPFSQYALFIYPIIILIATLGLFGIIRSHYKIILAMAIGGVMFNGYIIVHEIIISTYCLLCLMCTVIIIINGGLSIKGIRDSKKINKKL